MTTFTFAPATRERAYARIGLQGPAGSGKTMSALKIGQRLANGGPLGVIDTERGSALTYAPVPGRPDLGGIEFLHLPLDNYDPRNLIEATRAAAAARLPVLIIDSWSHFWNGKGGLLQIVEEAGNAPGAGGSFGGWRKGNPIEQDMLEALLNYPGHVLCTMRTKGDYSIEGKKVTKLGVKAVQREGAEYELGLIVDMVEGTGTVTKTRYAPLEGMTVHHPGADLAEVILDQLGQGVDPVEAILAELRADGLTYQGALEIYGRAERRGQLGLPAAHPTTGEVMPLGDAIKAVGVALKPNAAPAPTEQPSPARQALEEHADELAAPAPGERPAASGAVSAPQMRRIFALLRAVGGPEDRTERLDVVGLLLGRPVGSMNELASADGHQLIEVLGAFEGEGGRERFADTVTKLRQRAA
ncbi:AAA family ATPase [Actinacidiphila sp. bgisy145]|uniref:AAA family ATPase n=1 Tax=Actinacidiphila sp. bgisy145 TaxID=3413792 RepID=UPI003EBD13E3